MIIRRARKLRYNIYVIELDRSVLESKRFRDANPNMSSEGRCFYVGQSYLPPEERFQQHKDGYKANKLVKEYGIHLIRSICNEYNPVASREEALLLEEAMAKKLREEGHAVWCH